MHGINVLFSSLVLIAPLALIGIAIGGRRRGLRRNREETCAQCAGPLYAAGAFEGPSLLEGLQICARCAGRARVRLRAELGFVGLLVTTGVIAGTMFAFREGGLAWLLPFVPILEYGAMFGAAAAWMKRANLRRSAQLEAAGDVGIATLLAPATPNGQRLQRAAQDRQGERVKP